MKADILHAGFDGLKLTVDSQIPSETQEKLKKAKQEAGKNKRPVLCEVGCLEFLVRHSGNNAFSIHTGDYGAELYLHDPEAGKPIGPGVTVDFRAYFLATGGIDGAEAYLNELMDALGVSGVMGRTKISRVDFAVDFLAPWFVPEVEAFVLPARTKKRAFSEKDTSERFFENTEVSGITCGRVNNRQLVIYDKRAEVIGKKKHGWLPIWNKALSNLGKQALDIRDRNQSRVWRIENRVGAKCLRRRFELNSFKDLRDMIGDVFTDSLDRMRYAQPIRDANRSRWPDHELWMQLREVYASELTKYRSGVMPDEIRTVERAALEKALDQNIVGNLVTRAAVAGVATNAFWDFARSHVELLQRNLEQSDFDLSKRLNDAGARYRFR